VVWQAALKHEIDDLQLFVETAGEQGKKMEAAGGMSEQSTLEPLIGLANAISRSVQGELDQVSMRLDAVKEGREAADEQQKAGMEKRWTHGDRTRTLSTHDDVLCPPLSTR
jgi:hypothetical protein